MAFHMAAVFPNPFFMALDLAIGVLLLLHGMTCMATDAFHARHPGVSETGGKEAYFGVLEASAATDDLAFIAVWGRRRLTRLFWELVVVLGALAVLTQMVK
jgi:uncharacterized protein YhhL (DUF1145 family)